MTFFVGADIGGTSTKIAIVDDSGALRSYVTGPGGNFRTAPGEAFANISGTLARALENLDASSVQAGHFGVAGAGAARYEEINRACQELWNSQVPGARLSLSSDLEIAYSAASKNDGFLLLAGTGAVGCAFTQGKLIGRSDGMGWILGDVGAGLWLGRMGLEAAAKALDYRGPHTSLADSVLAHYSIDPNSLDVRQELISHVYELAPTKYGEIAPLVTAAAVAGDAVALGIVESGADALVTALSGAARDALVRDPGSGFAPVDLVLAGTLLSTPTVIKEKVLERIAADPALARLTFVEPQAPICGSLDRAAALVGFTLPALSDAGSL